MNLLIIVACIGFVIIVLQVIAKYLRKRSEENEVWPFYTKKPLSQPEQVLYFRLCKALPEYIVLAQVGLSRILGVKKGNNFGKWFNRINRMSADFVICSKDSTVVAVIELDDKSHAKIERQVADSKKDKALTSAGIKIIRWHVKNIPEEAAIRKEVVNA